MPKIIKNCDLILYADDTLIYSIGENDEECKRKLYCDILILNEWLKINKLILTVDKTKIMQINMNNTDQFTINSKEIETVPRIKCLGFNIDKSLNFNDHIDKMCKKIGYFRRIRS